jgi:hypothetical protein
MLLLLAVSTGCLHHHTGHVGHPSALGGGEGGPEPAPNYVLPPAQMLLEPGPGVGGPGPGVLDMQVAQASHFDAVGALSQVRFADPPGMKVAWQVDAMGTFSADPLITPGNMNFGQGAIYRLKLTNIRGHEGVALFPTLEIAPATPRSEVFLDHGKIPVSFTEEDFAQARAGNLVTKVIYVPYAEHQGAAIAGTDTVVSTRLPAGADPIEEADAKGTILAIVRLGNKDLEAPGPGQIKQMNFMQPDGMGGFVPAYPQFVGNTTTPMFISTMTMPQYGMPHVGTPIGLPGPPHIPLGGPAGLQQHSITNHTKTHIPGPTSTMDVHVKQSPGLSYPMPPNTMFIHERTYPAGPGPEVYVQPAESYPGTHQQPGHHP